MEVIGVDIHHLLRGGSSALWMVYIEINAYSTAVWTEIVRLLSVSRVKELDIGYPYSSPLDPVPQVVSVKGD